ncbi:MAG: hypothetical protein K6G83_09470 [Lachnospiraceae bacterium]|nr:hypothetical protein [Lachnospiraceae bacterium]
MTSKKGIRKIILAALTLISSFALTACPKGPQYSEEDREDNNEMGQVVMEEWMEKYYPEGKIIDSEPYTFIYPSGPSYLTDFVNGTMYDGEREREFSVNTVTGDVTLEPDEKMWEEFQECARELYLESMDFDKDCEIKDFSANVYYEVLSVSGRKGSWADSGFLAVGLPGELVAENGDVRAFVRDPERGCLLQVYGWITVPDTVDLSRYSKEDIEKRQEKYGLVYSGLEVFNNNEHLGWNGYERLDREEQ